MGVGSRFCAGAGAGAGIPSGLHDAAGIQWEGDDDGDGDGDGCGGD